MADGCSIDEQKLDANLQLFKAEVHCFCRDGRFYVLDVAGMRVHDLSALEARILLMTDDAVSALNSRSEKDSQIADAICDLQKQGMLNSSKLEYIPEFEKPDLAISNLMLNLSEECNLSCKYCLAQCGSYGNAGGKMSEKVACDSIDFLVRESRGEHLIISFFGGEPLLNFETIQTIIKHSRDMEISHDKKICHHLTTNGTLFDDEIISFLKNNGCRVTVSIDGDRENHDKMRIFSDGRGSFDRICQWLPLMIDKYQENVQLEGTLNSETRDFTGAAKFLQQFGAGHIYINHARGFVKEFRLDDVSLNFMKDAYSEFARFILDDAIQNKATINSAFSRYISTLASGNRARGFCAASTNLLSVSREGKIYPCPGFVGLEDYALGDIWQGIEPQKIAHLRETLADVDHIPACRACWARYLCAGGCIAESVAINKSPWEPCSYSCDLNRHIAELAIWIYAELVRRRPEFFLSLLPISKDLAKMIAF